jgi:dTDP-4-dehydrorhamnose reductase
MKILILGGSGLVGSRFIELAADYNIVAPAHEELDLLDLKNLETYLQLSDADIILNFAAFTNVDTAEEEKDNQDGMVYKLNVALPKALAQNAAAQNKYLIHISTDYVFGGTKPVPYTEDDSPNPVNWYGTTKMLGEDAVKENASNWLIVRPEMPYSSHFEKKLDIARIFVKMLKEGKQINGVSDQKITPTYVDILVWGLLKLIEARSTGIYHLASTDTTTPYDFAVMIADKFGLNKEVIKAVPFEEYNKTRTAKRPQNSYLDVTKFQTEFGQGVLKTVSESLDEFRSKLR